MTLRDTTSTNQLDELFSRVTVDLRDRLRTLGQKVTALAFDATGERLAIASSPLRASHYDWQTRTLDGPEQAAWVWVVRVRGGAILHEVKLPTQNAEPGDPRGGFEMYAEPLGPMDLAFSPDGAWLAVSWTSMLTPQLDMDCEAFALIDLERGVVDRYGDREWAWDGDSQPDAIESDDASLVMAFAPGSRLLVSACVLWGEVELTRCVREGTWKFTGRKKGAKGKKSAKELTLSTGARLAFGTNNQRLVMADATSGVTFVDIRSGKSLGRSRAVRLERTLGPLVAAPDALSAWSVSRVRRAARGSRSQDGLWRWAPRVTPTLVAKAPGRAAEGWKILWLAPDAREVLWSDPDGALVRQHVADPSGASASQPLESPRLTRPRPCSLVKELQGDGWEQVVVSADGKRLARTRDGLVLVTRLRRRSTATAGVTPRSR